MFLCKDFFFYICRIVLNLNDICLIKKCKRVFRFLDFVFIGVLGVFFIWSSMIKDLINYYSYVISWGREFNIKFMIKVY